MSCRVALCTLCYYDWTTSFSLVLTANGHHVVCRACAGHKHGRRRDARALLEKKEHHYQLSEKMMPSQLRSPAASSAKSMMSPAQLFCDGKCSRQRLQTLMATVNHLAEIPLYQDRVWIITAFRGKLTAVHKVQTSYVGVQHRIGASSQFVALVWSWRCLFLATWQRG